MHPAAPNAQHHTMLLFRNTCWPPSCKRSRPGSGCTGTESGARKRGDTRGQARQSLVEIAGNPARVTRPANAPLRAMSPAAASFPQQKPVGFASESHQRPTQLPATMLVPAVFETDNHASEPMLQTPVTFCLHKMFKPRFFTAQDLSVST